MNKKQTTYITNSQLRRARIGLGDDSSISKTQLRKIRSLLLAKAHKKHGQIKPCGTWDKCFTIEGNTVFFWYQTSKDDSTHLVAHNFINFYSSNRNRTANTGMRNKVKKISNRPVTTSTET